MALDDSTPRLPRGSANYHSTFRSWTTKSSSGAVPSHGQCPPSFVFLFVFLFRPVFFSLQCQYSTTSFIERWSLSSLKWCQERCQFLPDTMRHAVPHHLLYNLHRGELSHSLVQSIASPLPTHSSSSSLLCSTQQLSHHPPPSAGPHLLSTLSSEDQIRWCGHRPVWTISSLVD